jgi:hypothetical protein
MVEMDQEPAEVVALWPSLAPLVWRFEERVDGVLVGTRWQVTHAEALWVIDESRAGVRRCQTAVARGATEDFSGSLTEAVDVLLQVVHWETDR